MHGDLLFNVGLSIVAGTVLAYVARQPLLLGYIAAGVLIGPVGFKLVGQGGGGEEVAHLAELGLAFLMFIVGLEIDIRKLLATGKTAAVITIVQVAGSALLGFAAALALAPLVPLPPHGQVMSAAYIGVAAAFSSTMIVVKLLSDRGELDTLPGRLTLGILLLQDVGAIVVLAIQPNLGQGLPALAMFVAAVKGLALVAGALLASHYLLPLLFRWVAVVPEVILLSAVTWCFVVCYAAIALGFSSAMGALIAGVSIAAYPYTLDVVAKIRGLRDFFVTLFFVSLGMLLQKPTLGLLAAAVVLTLVVMISRLVTIWPMARLFGYGSRVGLLSSIHNVPISEFGLVVVLLGGPTGFKHVWPEVVSLVVILMVITSMDATYLIHYSHRLARLVTGTAQERETAKRRRKLQRSGDPGPQDAATSDGQTAEEGETTAAEPAAPILLVGCFRIGSSLVHELRGSGRSFRVIDFNPKVRADLQRLGVDCLYGDISHMDTLVHAGADRADILVASIPDDFLRGTGNDRLLATLRRINPRAKVIVTAESLAQALRFYQDGADYVILQRVLAAEELMQVIAQMEKRDDKFEAQWQHHIAQLRQRAEVIP